MLQLQAANFLPWKTIKIKDLPWSQSIPPQFVSQMHCHEDPLQYPCLHPGYGSHWSQKSPLHPGRQLQKEEINYSHYSVKLTRKPPISQPLVTTTIIKLRESHNAFSWDVPRIRIPILEVFAPEQKNTFTRCTYLLKRSMNLFGRLARHYTVRLTVSVPWETSALH